MNEAWGFGHYDVDDAEGAAGGDVEADVEVAALAFDDVGDQRIVPPGLYS